MCKYPPLILVFSQCISENGNIITAQFAGVADRVEYGLLNEFDAVLLNNFPFIILVIYVNISAGVMLDFKNIL